MTDKRNDAILERCIDALPPNSGIIFRHYHLPDKQRADRFAVVRHHATTNGHQLLLSDNPDLARQWIADGVHGRQWQHTETDGLLHSAPVHNKTEIEQAEKNGADLLFLSPIFATRSHPEQQPMEREKLEVLIGFCSRPVILLGGMTEARFQGLSHLPVHGWAAINGLNPATST